MEYLEKYKEKYVITKIVRNNKNINMVGRKKNDGRGRLGGRAKGTPNKTTTDLKTWVAFILDGGREQFEQDLRNLEPPERVKVFTGLLNYVLPKQQAVSVEAQVEAEYKALEGLLESAPAEFVDKIAEKIVELSMKK